MPRYGLLALLGRSIVSLATLKASFALQSSPSTLYLARKLVPPILLQSRLAFLTQQHPPLPFRPADSAGGDTGRGGRGGRGSGPSDPFRGGCIAMCGTVNAAGEPMLAVAYNDPQARYPVDAFVGRWLVCLSQSALVLRCLSRAQTIQMYALPSFEDRGSIGCGGPNMARSLLSGPGFFLSVRPILCSVAAGL